MNISELLAVDSFNSAEEYITFQLTSSRGRQNCISRETLISLADECGIPISPDMKKRELVETVYAELGRSLLYFCKNTGVTAYFFMKKYALLPYEVIDFEAEGFLEKTGELCYRKNGKAHYVNLYSAYQYFGLNEKIIGEWRRIIEGGRY